MNENKQPETEWIDVEPVDVQEGDEAYWTMPDSSVRVGAVLRSGYTNIPFFEYKEFDSTALIAKVSEGALLGVRFRRKVPRVPMVPREWEGTISKIQWKDSPACVRDDCWQFIVDVRGGPHGVENGVKVRIIEVIE